MWEQLTDVHVSGWAKQVIIKNIFMFKLINLSFVKEKMKVKSIFDYI
jgi:hypothetical protein